MHLSYTISKYIDISLGFLNYYSGLKYLIPVYHYFIKIK